ncbi:hypothetical protein E4U36_006669 [Claviceps purpurea]|nr:hypothetical protein E4U36_006669 [Claviceps purpurea]
MNNPFFSMAAPVATGVTFAGLPKDGPATEYLKHCQMMAAMSNVPKEYADTFTRHVFIQGLRGKAEMWYQDLDFDDRVWVKMSDQFLKKFEKPDPLFEMALQKEVVGFAREKGETLKAFIQRAERLASKVKSELRQMLFTNFISNLADGEVDLRLQERISDRLYSSTKWTNGMASKDLTMSDLKVLMYDCRTSASENIPKLSEEAITPASPFHQWMEDQAKRDKGKDDQMSELVRQLEAFRAQTVNDMSRSAGQYNRQIYNSNDTSHSHGNRANNSNDASHSHGNRATTSSAYGRGDPDFYWCFKCGDWGHMGYNCSHKDTCSAADEERRREQWMQTGYQMKKERRRELDGQTKLDGQMKSNYVGDLGGDQIPPPGYMPVPRMQSFQASTSFYHPPSCVEDQEDVGFAGAAARSSKGKGKATDPVQTRGSNQRVNKPTGKPGISMNEQVQNQIQEILDSEDPQEMPIYDGSGELPQQPRPAQEMTETEFQSWLPVFRRHLETNMTPVQGPSVPREVVMKDAGPKGQPRRKLDLENIRATEKYNIPAFDLGKHLGETTVPITVLQLLQLAPIIRRQMGYLMQCQRKLKGDEAKSIVSHLMEPYKEVLNPMTSNSLGSVNNVVTWNDVAKSEGEVPTSLGYITTYVEGIQCDSALVDGGSSVELVSDTYLARHGLPAVQLNEKRYIRMANDAEQPIHLCAYLRVVTGGILALVKCYVMPAQQDWELLLGKVWLRRLNAVEHHGEEKLTITGPWNQGTDANSSTISMPRLVPE